MFLKLACVMLAITCPLAFVLSPTDSDCLTAWSSCNQTCGLASTKTRLHHCKLDYQKCCPCPYGGIPDGPSRCKQCGSGYFGACCKPLACRSECSSGEWESTPCGGSDGQQNRKCTPCTSIANCASTKCTTATDQVCLECDHDYGTYQAYFWNNETITCDKLCSWRADSSFCYPGVCSGHPNVCACADNFSGTSCLTITAGPTITSCESMAYKHGNQSDFLIINCTSDKQITYSGMILNTIEIDTIAMFKNPNTTRLEVVKGVKLGVVQTHITFELIRGSNKVDHEVRDCGTGSSVTSPIAESICNMSFTHSGSLQHADVITIALSAKNGGYVDIYNPKVCRNRTYFYHGKTTVHQADVVFDFEPPVHCSLGGNICQQNFLDQGPAFTKEGNIVLTWQGWTDSPSGIDKYDLDIFYMKSTLDVLKSSLDAHISFELTSSTSSQQITLNEIGVYSIELRPVDRVGHYIQARRFIMFDDSSDITIHSGNQSRALWVPSAVSNSSYKWITSLQNSQHVGPQVYCKWVHHYTNELHDQHNWLSAISEHIDQQDVLYEDATGQPPLIRSREAIPNIRGITRYEIGFTLSQFGASVSPNLPPTNWKNVPYFQTEEALLDIPRQDGDSVLIFVKGFDVIGNFGTDTVLVHVDSSPPVIADVWLMSNGIRYLAVHSTLDLADLNLEFTTYDLHSGLKEIHWMLFDKKNVTKVYAKGPEPARRRNSSEECFPSNCYCLPKDLSECYYQDHVINPKLGVTLVNPDGTHDFDYVFVLNVTNNAMHSTIFEYQITIDTSPPVKGVVKDSEAGSPDLDYQQSPLIHASWEGFFDKQSGVLFYVYSTTGRCLNSGEIGHDVIGIRNTSNTFAEYVVPSPGLYYTTVVAYNGAGTPSLPACSDGITVDDSPPSLTQIHVEGLHVHGGLARDDDEHIWYIDDQRQRQLVENTTSECGIIDAVADIEDFPINQDRRAKYRSIPCNKIRDSPRTFYLPHENKLELFWVGADEESGIYDYEVGLSTTSSEDTDILPFTSTHSHSHFISYHPGLADDLTFFLHLIAINRAGRMTKKVLGPIIVDVDKPQFTGDIEVQLGTFQGNEYLVAEWDADSFSQIDISNDIISKVFVAVGETPYGEDTMRFTDTRDVFPVDSLCSNTIPPTCVALLFTSLDRGIHGRHDYYVTVRVVSIHGLVTMVTAGAYSHLHGPPVGGVVVEVPLTGDTNIIHDIDHQASSKSVRVEWHGFYHAHQNINYSVALGSYPGGSDIVPFIGAMKTTHTFTGLALEAFKIYYTTIQASTKDGSSLVTSDGLTILPLDIVPAGFQVFDGTICSSNTTFDYLPDLHHYDRIPYNGICNEDVNYQSSQTTLGSFWHLPPELTKWINDVWWTYEMEHENGSWISQYEGMFLGKTESFSLTNLHLDGGRKYRVAASLCHSEGCLQKTHSDGLTILPLPPVVTGTVQVQHNPEIKNRTSADNSSLHNDILRLAWNRFKDPYVGEDLDVEYYWTIVVKQKDQTTEQLLKWSYIPLSDVNESFSGELVYEADLPYALQFSKCLTVVIKGYNPVGLQSSIFGKISGCDFESQIKPIVIDAIGTISLLMPNDENIFPNIELDLNALWPTPDAEYTPYDTTLSAVWPTLRHASYAWKVVSDAEADHWAYQRGSNTLSFHKYHCSSPATLACGLTKENFINVKDLHLEHGKRYYVCILANATTLHFEKFDHNLEAVTACSNGIVVDLEDPKPGFVWLGRPGIPIKYQSLTDELAMHWAGFEDIEMLGSASHNSGIRSYKVSIGSHAGGTEVLNNFDVGLVNMAVAHNIKLRPGFTYFATLSAMDYVGRETVAVSEGVTIDVTPPVTTNTRIDTGGMFVTSPEVSANWRGVFTDPESGVSHNLWCVGSSKRFCDIVPTTNTKDEFTSSVDLAGKFIEGHEYFFLIQAVNHVGLSVQATSKAIIIDTTAPIGGYVYDLSLPSDDKDNDYKVFTDDLHFLWGGFHDPHSSMKGYWVTVGKCKQCEDIMEETFLGLTTELSLTNAVLTPGQPYYATVTGCNNAGLCAKVSSDGIIIDNTPPIIGQVYDGISGEDIDYQSDRHTISAHWTSVHDVHSGLSRMEWGVGTAPGRFDILPLARLHITAKIMIRVKDALPINKKMYITLKAYNKAGLERQCSSDGFVVDESPPSFKQKVVFDGSGGSIKANTQIWKSSIHFSWEVFDTESFIYDQFIAIMTRDSVYLGIPTIRVYGHITSHSLTGLSLLSGETYYVKIRSCNGAKLCTTSVSDGLLIDNSPPSSGAFAVETEHAAMLTRHRLGWMTFYNNVSTPFIKLAWLGFVDAHSGIEKYYVKIGSRYTFADLTKDAPFVVEHNSTEAHEDEGYLQRVDVPVNRNLTHKEMIYIAIWAENHVGLSSPVLHGSFEVRIASVDSGILDLFRRCESVSCMQHCTCGASGTICPGTSDCLDVTGTTGHAPVKVIDITNYQYTGEETDISSLARYSPSHCSLGAVWYVNDSSITLKPFMYEWSVRMEGGEPGGGLWDVHLETVWREPGHHNRAFYTTDDSLLNVTLKRDIVYQFLVRAWYNESTYAVFSSDGIKIDATPPRVSSSRKVKEVAEIGTTVDVDFTTSSSEIHAIWPNVFFESESNVTYFDVSLGTCAGCCDLAKRRTAKDLMTISFTGLQLQQHVWYYVTVEAVNDYGMSSSAHSDGIQVDLDPPIAGFVWDGDGLHDVDYKEWSTTSYLTARWHGFSDKVSAIREYFVGFGLSPLADDVVRFQSVGLQTMVEQSKVNETLTGRWLYSSVYAVDAAGYKSEVISSDGVLYDTTSPVAMEFLALGPSLVEGYDFNPEFAQNPTADETTVVFRHFESTLTSTESDVYKTSAATDVGINPTPEMETFLTSYIYKWNFTGNVDVINETVARDKGLNWYACIRDGSVRQTISTVIGKRYRVHFYGSHAEHVTDFYSEPTGYILMPGERKQFVQPVNSLTSSGSPKLKWLPHTYFFTASEKETIIVIGSLGKRNAVAIDKVIVQELLPGPRRAPSDENHPATEYTQPVHVYVTYTGDLVNVVASWDVEDAESPIVGYMWALGSVRGGAQVLNFEYLGRRSSATHIGLWLQHNTNLFVTVIAENAAGLVTILYSDPILIDYTSPVLCCIEHLYEGVGSSYSYDGSVSAHWTVSDLESDIESCMYAIGKSPSSSNVIAWNETHIGRVDIQLDQIDVQHGEDIYISICCTNYVGHETCDVSSPIMVIRRPIDTSPCSLMVVAESESIYPTTYGYQSDTTSLQVRVDNIRNIQEAIDHLLITVSDLSNGEEIWTYKTSAGLEKGSFFMTDLVMEDTHQYGIHVTAVDVFGQLSSGLFTNITVRNTPPSLSGRNIDVTWPSPSTLLLNWEGVFDDESPMVYEASIGKTAGGTDVLSWTETRALNLEILYLDTSRVYYVTLTAINKAGLFETHRQVVGFS